MPHVIQYPLRRPHWVTWAGAAIGAAALAALAYCLAVSYTIIIALLLLWQFRRRQMQAALPGGHLILTAAGLWQIQAMPGRAAQPLFLVHAWPAFGWVTLRFDRCPAATSKDTMFEATIWKWGIAPEAWRRLRIHLARQIAAPGPARTQAGP